MSYQPHQLAKAIRDDADPAVIEEMRYEIAYERRMDNYEPPERDDD